MWRRLKPEQVQAHSTGGQERMQTRVAQVEQVTAAESAAAARATRVEQVHTLVDAASNKVTRLIDAQLQKVWNGSPQCEGMTQSVLATTSAAEVRGLIRDDMDGDVKARLQESAELLDARATLHKKVKSDVQCVFGTCREDASREQMVASREQSVAEVSKDNKFHVMWMEYPLTASGSKWGVGGRVDGVDDHGRVVEIKNRIRRFFPVIPEYEMVQVQTYMAVLNKDETVFVQQLNGQQRSTVIQRDALMWSVEIVPALYKFMNVLDLFIADDSHVLREEWMCCDGKAKAALLNAWLEQGDEEGGGNYVF
jgi:hypothetical protein